MSVYVHKKSKDGVFSYDFQVSGQRFSGSTGKTSRREAEAEERRLRDDARSAISARNALDGPRLTIIQACDRYWAEKKDDYSSQDNLLRNLDWIQAHFGAKTMLHEIDDNKVARMVAARRGETNQNFKKEKRRISNGTVNSTSIKPLQRILNRAAIVWKMEVQTIDWKKHLLKETQERIREASKGEEDALFQHLDKGYEDAVQFAMTMGARRMEILALEWTDIDFFSDRLTLRGKGKRSRIVPIPSSIRTMLWGLKNNHPEKVFTFEAERTRIFKNGKSYVRGQRYPLTANMLKYAFRRAREAAGVVDYRFHDNRHTAATRLLRRNGNLRLVQRLLGHADIKTTVKYAHATIDDLAEAMSEDAENPGKNPGKSELKKPSN